MISKKKIFVILTPGFPKDEDDTTCLPERQAFIRSLKSMHPHIRIVILSFHYPYFKRTYEWNGVEVISFNGRNKRGPGKALIWLQVWRKFKRLRTRNEIAGVLSFWLGEAALLGNYFARIYRVKHYCWMLGQDARKGNKYFKIIRPEPASLIAISDALSDELFKNFKIRPYHIITSGIEASSVRFASVDRNIDILGAGSFIELKQYQIFISVIRAVSTTMPGVKATLYGKGPEKNKLQTLIAAYSLQENISLFDEISHPELMKKMQQAKILLHTSSYEGLSTVCLEALAAGCKVVSFCKPMMANINNWYIVSEENEMVNQVIFLLKNANIQYEPVIPFRVEDSAKKLMNLYALSGI